jgi:copper homeostasis protein
MIELIAVSIEDAKKIEANGGDRIELVSALSEGGLTSSYGVMKKIIESVSIPVNVIIDLIHNPLFIVTKRLR